MRYFKNGDDVFGYFPFQDDLIAEAISKGWQDVSETWPAESVIQGPASITALQGLLAIDHQGLGAAYEAWANDSSRTFKERAFITKAMMWERDNPVVVAAGVALGLTAAQIDALFALASTL
jgi:hypothetical protein